MVQASVRAHEPVLMIMSRAPDDEILQATCLNTLAAFTNSGACDPHEAAGIMYELMTGGRAGRADARVGDAEANAAMLMAQPYQVHQHVLAAISRHVQSQPVQAEGCRALASLCLSGSWARGRGGGGRKPGKVGENLQTRLLSFFHSLHRLQCPPFLHFPCPSFVSFRFVFVSGAEDNRRVLANQPYFAHHAVLNAMRVHAKDASVALAACMMLATLALTSTADFVGRGRGLFFLRS